MKNPSHKSALPAALIAGLVLMLAGRATAQTFTTLYSFTATSGDNLTNSDGANPIVGLITNSSGNTLYGTAKGGGSSGVGTVFAVNTDGTGFTNLHAFAGVSDGAYPAAGLIISGNTLYGTAGGGSSGSGTIFAVNTDGTGFTTQYSFGGGSDGYDPQAALLLSGTTLYGTAVGGGASDNGTVFAVNTGGTGFTTLHSFTAPSGFPSTNSDGNGPTAGLVLSGNTLYGTAEYGGGSGNGTVFKVNTNGSGFTPLHSFTARSGSNSTNSDGAYPQAGLILSGTTLYGTAPNGGSSGKGTVFAVNTDGTGFTTLHSFAATSGFPSTNSEGANPVVGLILSGNTLYGTAVNGGSSGNGTVFAVNTDGTGFTTLHSFSATSGSYPLTNSDGSSPNGLIISGNTLYGTAGGGGSSGNGTVFSLSLGPGTSSTNPTTAVTSSLNPSVYGEAGVTFTATVTGSGGTPAGTVQFQTNGVNFGNPAILSAGGSATSGTLPVTLPAGTCTVTAAYSGDANFSSSSGSLNGGQTVTKAASATAVASASNPSLVGQAGVTFTATVTDSSSGSTGTPAGTVQFTTNGVDFGGAAALFGGSATSGALSVTLPADTYTVTALYSGDQNFTTSSGTLSGGQNVTTNNVSTNNPCDCAGSNGVMAAGSFTTLHSFTNGSDGAQPVAGLILSGNALYGTATGRGTSDYGTVFALNTNGTGFTILHGFTATSGSPATNSDGGLPYAGLI
ncbi:MAG: beta strand repeat-containing protein, partial [Limisphaerales bacterium]